MYSPKIREDLIPKLYQVAKGEGVSMAKLVDQIIRNALGNGRNKKKKKEK